MIPKFNQDDQIHMIALEVASSYKALKATPVDRGGSQGPYGKARVRHEEAQMALRGVLMFTLKKEGMMDQYDSVKTPDPKPRVSSS